MADQEKKNQFETDLKRLEEIVQLLEDGGQSLDDSLKLFEEGQKLLKKCRKLLSDAQVKVSKLLESGEIVEINPDELGR